MKRRKKKAARRETIVALRVTPGELRQIRELKKLLRLSSYSKVVRFSLFGRKLVGDVVALPRWTKGRAVTWEGGTVRETGKEP